MHSHIFPYSVNIYQNLSLLEKEKGLRSILIKILIGVPVSNFTKLFYIEAEHFLMITVKWRSMNYIYNKETVDTSKSLTDDSSRLEDDIFIACFIEAGSSFYSLALL